MALSIAGISGIGGLGGVSAIPQSGISVGGSKTSGTGFADTLANALDSVQGKVNAADQAAMGVATGDVTASEYLTAATDAQLTVQLALAVRNRAVEAFNEIMRMPV